MTYADIHQPASIGEIAADSGLSVHTLRYYERIGLIEPVPRASSGHRQYSPRTLERIEALSYLRASGMSVEDMRTYMDNLARGDAAAAEHAELLFAHARKLEEEIAQLRIRHGYIEAKASFWKAVAEKGRETPEARAYIERATAMSKVLR
jgi:DNA-binding transcriptional MerR regulator